MDQRRARRAFWRSRLKELAGIDDTSGVEILSMIRALTRLSEFVEGQFPAQPDLSGPRWGLLMLLLAHERKSGSQGVTPTALSHFQGVSRNTISSLLRGLEEQGYIERALDPQDHRVFRIRLTDAGREVAQCLAPERVAFMNRLAAGLSPAEREELIGLLDKLHESIVAQAGLSPRGCHGPS
jgi:DNA-binding MarR family transcriptional regulator